jgi:hypothetical protein
LSLSGGRLGSKREDIRAPIPGLAPSAGALRLTAQPETLPEYAFSHIYTAGEHEFTAAGVPASSRWAGQLRCGKRAQRADVADTKAGYVYDSSGARPPSKIWGLKPGPGKAEVFVYPHCEEGRVVADVVRLGKGHTEGLEPNVTEEFIRLMLSATP